MNLPTSDNVNITDRFRPKPVGTDTVLLTINSLNETRSVGSDSISLKFIKDGLYVIAFYLACIINTSLVTGTFPQAWKHSSVFPLFKNRDPDKVNNYYISFTNGY